MKITWEQVEEIRAQIPPRSPSGSLGSTEYDEKGARFGRALRQYKRAHGVSWFGRSDWDYNLHKVK